MFAALFSTIKHVGAIQMFMGEQLRKENKVYTNRIVFPLRGGGDLLVTATGTKLKETLLHN